MSGAPDLLYVAARRVLLDALEGVRDQVDALVLVGAQAVYIHAGEADLAVAPYTTDGDLAVDPARLSAEPLLEDALARAGFLRPENEVGVWQKATVVGGHSRLVAVDLLVPETLGGAGRRGARIPPHGQAVARKAAGLEGTLVDQDQHLLRALDPADTRQVLTWVAGPAGLIVAKVHKIAERLRQADRGRDKDALDVYRLLRAVETPALVRRFSILVEDARAQGSTKAAIELLPTLFGSLQAPGTLMAVRAAAPEPGDTLAAALVALMGDLLRDLRSAGVA